MVGIVLVVKINKCFFSTDNIIIYKYNIIYGCLLFMPTTTSAVVQSTSTSTNQSTAQ